MSTLLTILVWLGSGFAFSVGVLVGAWLCRLSFSRSTSDRQVQDDSLAALRERNEIGREQCDALHRIADSLREQNSSSQFGK